jgi:hypothetical protein
MISAGHGSRSPFLSRPTCIFHSRCPMFPTMLRTTPTLPAGFIAPCLPTKAETLPSGGLWLHEIKHERPLNRDHARRIHQLPLFPLAKLRRICVAAMERAR